MTGDPAGGDSVLACAACGSDNPGSNRFCFECGRSLARRCESCGAELPAHARFCGACGAPAASGAGEPRPEAADLAARVVGSDLAEQGERKTVSVLFADVVGSTALIRDLDAEDAVTRLEPAVEAMKQAVRRHEGTVNRIQGDGIMALFGAPIAHEDHAARACLAALAMCDAVAALGSAGLAIRVGVHSGDVVVRAVHNDLTVEYEADGPAVHLAARMEQLAAPGTVRTTAATLALCEGAVESRACEAVAVKGFDDRVEQRELVRAVPAASRWEIRARRGLTAFTGRQSELEVLTTALERSRDGDGQVVAVVAEAGMGKSRLVHEFLEHRVPSQWTVRVAAASSDGASTPFLPIRRLLRSVLDASPSDDRAALADKLGALVTELADDVDRLRAPLEALLDLPVADQRWRALEPAQRRRRMIDAFRILALRRAERAPLLLVVEDLHWIDSETRAALDALTESIPASRALVVVTYRPEFVDPWTSRGWHRSVRLTGLGGAAAIDLVRGLVGPDPALGELVSLVASGTEGRPLFVEETVRGLVDDGVLEGVRGAYRGTRAVRDFRVPASVQAVLAARIDRLEPATKRVLQVASVIGREVPRALLVSALALDEGVLDAHLGELRAGEFMFDLVAASEPAYLFKHALTRSVAYETLLREHRRELHASVLRAMEHRYAGRLDEWLEALGRHALEGGCWDDAARYLRSAGAKATDQSAYVEAKALLEQALEAVAAWPPGAAALETGVDLRMEMRPALGALGHYPAILERLDECETLATTLADDARLLAVGADKIHALYMLGRVTDAIAHGEGVVDAAVAAGDRRLFVQASCNLAQAHLFNGAARRSVEIVEPLVDELRGPLRLERLGTTATSSVLWLGNLCGAHAQLGDFERSFESGAAGRAVAAETGKPFDLTMSAFWSGFGLNEQGRAEEAEPLLREGLALAREHGLPFTIQWGMGELSRACRMLGLLGEAVSLAAESTALTRALGIVIPRIWYDAYKAEIALAADPQAPVEPALRELLRAIERTGAHWFEPLVCRLLAGVLADAGPTGREEARALLAAALERCRAAERGPEQAHVLLALAALEARVGSRADAMRTAGEAAALYRTLRMERFVPDAERLVAGV